MKNTGVDLWQCAAEDLNRIIQRNGSIQPNNRGLWKSYLNLWDNQDWCDVLEAVYAVYTQEPQHLKKNHLRAMRTALSVLADADHPRILDTAEHRSTAWQMFMALREIWNSVNNTVIVNPDTGITGRIYS